MSSLDYTPPPVLAEFMKSNKRVRMVRGPVGSAKSTACVMELLRRAAEQTPGPDGIRRTHMCIVRNTLAQLKTTSLETIRTMLRPIMHYKVSDSTVHIRVGDIESDWLMLPLDTPENVQRLLSLELTYAWISEFREADPEIVMSLYSRTGRYPSVVNGGPTNYGLIGETNSFSEDSPWFKRLELELPDNWGYFVQPGAFDEGAENLENLPVEYYQDMVVSNTEQWVDQYVHNKITPSLSGQAVFRSSFNAEFHVAKSKLTPVPGYPLIIGMDFARWPAAVICQMDHKGRLLVMAELESENTGVEKFINTSVLPLLATERFRGFSSYIVGDPSGIAKAEVGEESVFMMLKRLGFTAFPASTNHISPRIRAVEKFLLQQRGGEAALLIDPYCLLLLQAMKSMYRYKKKKDGQLEDKPDKSKRPWADLADSLQYACLGTAANIVGRVMRPAREAKPAPPKGGWT